MSLTPLDIYQKICGYETTLKKTVEAITCREAVDPEILTMISSAVSNLENHQGIQNGTNQLKR